MPSCRKNTDNVFDFAAAMLFQGLTSAQYVKINDSDRALNATAVTMVKQHVVDVEYGYRTITSERISQFAMVPFARYSVHSRRLST